MVKRKNKWLLFMVLFILGNILTLSIVNALEEIPVTTTPQHSTESAIPGYLFLVIIVLITVTMLLIIITFIDKKNTKKLIWFGAIIGALYGVGGIFSRLSLIMFVFRPAYTFNLLIGLPILFSVPKELVPRWLLIPCLWLITILFFSVLGMFICFLGMKLRGKRKNKKRKTKK